MLGQVFAGILGKSFILDLLVLRCYKSARPIVLITQLMNYSEIDRIML